MRFIATADWQLGMTASFLSEEARARYKQSRIDAISRIGILARETGAELVLVCGDVFESNQLDRQVVARACEALRSVPVPVYLLPGNHDPLDASSVYTSEVFVGARPDHVHVLTESGPVVVRPGLEIVAAPWRSKRPVGDLVAAALDQAGPAGASTVRILAGHGAVDSRDPDRDNPATIGLGAIQAALDDGRVHVAVLGDRHSLTRVTDQVWYPGTPEVTARREVDPGHVLVVDVLPDEPVQVTARSIGEWSFLVHDHELDGRRDIAELDRWLGAVTAKERTAVWLRLTGTLCVSDKAELDAALARHEPVFAALTLWQRHHDLAVLADDADFSDLGLTGFAAEAVRELRDRAVADEAAADALGLLYRLAGAGQ